MTGTPVSHSAVRALFEAALEQPIDRRAHFLLKAAPDDPALRDEVAELLAAHEDSGEPFDDSFVHALGDLARGNGPTLVGRTVGAYRVTREIGHGGMGVVYEAERADEQFTKRVAIKTLRGGRGTTDMLRRFARERRIQAALAHPNIATLLDAGVTEDGLPYIVLEYIDGVPIDAYCREHALPLRARLELFQQVVDAVQHAHRQLVVHRDLKPSNILVTADGKVKLLDFGISKLIDESAEHTATEAPRAFTTAYASPEQLRGDPVSTATDVYSLGVVLYRLLSGVNPFPVDDVSWTVAWRTICETDPSPPSTMLSDEAARTMGFTATTRLQQALQGELDAIVLMALRKEPERRYATADALGEDVQNFLRDRPVSARPDSAGYRVRKLVLRNRLATGALAVAFVAMAGGTMAALWQAREARRALATASAQREVAVRERRTAEAVSTFMQQMFSAADRSWAGGGVGPATTIAEVVDSAAVRVDRDLADEPDVAEALHHILKSTHTALQQTEKGVHHASRELDLMEGRGASGVEIARGKHDLAALLFLQGKRDSSLLLLRQSYALFEAAGFPESEDLSLTLNQLGLTLWDSGKPAEAEPYLERALDVRRRVMGNDVVAAIICSNLGIIRDARGDLDGAERYHRQAETIYAGLEGREYFEHGYNLNNLANVLLLKGESADAEQQMQQSLRVLEEVLGPDHVTLGLGRFNLARIELAEGRPREALATLRKGRTFLSALPPNHADRARGDTYEASILLALGEPVEAERLARRALAIRDAAYPDGDWRIAETMGVLGRIRVARGAVEDGRALLSESRANLARALGAAHPRTREIDDALAASAAVASSRP